ncbi:MAG: beta galactosidase jelly roll domain-containing protein [Opitutaceae bacterium]|jgi:beta-glucuronidase|nr:beta galactosidase jelly roll domain-containing protein [Opitutaceae bacterium]
MRKNALLLLASALALLPVRALDLDLADAPWSFAADPADLGESKGYHLPPPDWAPGNPHSKGWDTVSIPHDFLTDPRHALTGTGWYRRDFTLPDNLPPDATCRLRFDTVFQRCRVWLNGRLVGSHEGGYTPFEFSVAPFLRPGRNLLAVAVDNRVRFRALPGARSGGTPNSAQYPWLNYGGILGGVRLLAHEPVWLETHALTTTPSPAGWRLSVTAVIRNDSTAARSGQVAAVLPSLGQTLSAPYSAAPGAATSVTLSADIPSSAAVPWSPDNPVLHPLRLSLDGKPPPLENTFGFRSVEIRDARLLLNGKPVRLAGANRARGHPVHGGIDTDALVAADLRLMKDAGLVFARLQHTAPGENLLNEADRLGFLLVLEVGMWGYAAPDLASPELRSQFLSEMRELVRLARNHPSVIAWSLGNEYESWTPEGVAWTRDMAAAVKSLDPSRPVTFAALGSAFRHLKSGEPEPDGHAFDHVDYISANLYFPPEKVPAFLDPVHARWPGKPVAITEFGLRTDKVKDEAGRVAHLDAFLALIKTRPWICGLSYWSFNDYASRYPGSGADGYRRWGLVDEFRRPRALYEHLKPLLKNGLP